MSAQSTVPHGFPAKLEGPLAWDGKTYQDHPEGYILQLKSDEIDVVDKALRHFQNLNLAPGHLSSKTFPLPMPLSTKLAEISNELYNGRGFVVLRGLDPSKYSPEENVILFAGVASHVAPERSTDPNGLTLSHIRRAQDDKIPGKNPDELRPSKRSDAMAFHTDTAIGDILSMYIKGLHDNDGGKQYLASFWQIYNILAKEAPDVLRTLAEPYPWEEVDPITNEARVDNRPLIFFVDGKVQIQFVTVPLLGSSDHPRPSELPSLDPAQKKALEVLQTVAKRVSLELNRAPGDIQFVNNLGILHGRGPATGDPDTKISVYTISTTSTVITTVKTEVEEKAVSSTTHTETNPIINVDEDSGTTTATTITSSKDVTKTVADSDTETTATTKTVSTHVTTTETTVRTKTTDEATSTSEGDKVPFDFKVTVQNDKVDGDLNTKRIVESSTSFLSTTCPYKALERARASGALRTRMVGYQSPRHFLRLFLRDGRHSWRKPDVYREKFEQCFIVPAEKQFLPAIDFDPHKATTNGGETPHG